MTVVRTAIRILDSSIGRTILEAYATWHARRTSGRDVTVLYDQVWMHQIDGLYWADSDTFAYHRLITPKWVRSADTQQALGRDYWFHIYEPQPGDVIVDIGAGTGTDLPLFSNQVGTDGRVLAIEAHPMTFAMLARVVERNELKNVSCYQKAIIDKTCIVSITDDEQHVSNAIEFEGQASLGKSIDVEGCTLAAICKSAGVGQIDLLKMNIEGAEQYAILGMVDVLERIRCVCIACHDFRADSGDGEQFRTRKLVKEFLADHGFDITTRDNDSRPYVRDHIHGWNRNWIYAP